MKENLKDVKEVLFIVDMNNGFCNNGNLADPDIKKIIPNIINWVTIYRMRGAQIVNVNDKHTEGSVELKRYAMHCHNDEESKTVSELYDQVKDAKEFYKNSTCALFAPGMMDYLMDLVDLERVVIVGCCSDICIQNFAIALRNFFDELNMDIEIVVPFDAIDTFNIPNVHERDKVNLLASKEMERNGIKLIRKLEVNNNEK